MYMLAETECVLQYDVADSRVGTDHQFALKRHLYRFFEFLLVGNKQVIMTFIAFQVTQLNNVLTGRQFTRHRGVSDERRFFRFLIEMVDTDIGVGIDRYPSDRNRCHRIITCR